MTTTFINPFLSTHANLGTRPFDDTDPIRFWQQSSEEEAEIAIRAVYRQVLGNAHVMESERLFVPESQLKQGEISVREFVRHLAKSELYRSRFVEDCPRSRTIELNFKHLLGRAPESYEETTYHSQILDQAGYEADIDSYIDSEEYSEAFGEDVVPYYRGYKTQPGKKMVGFTHMFQLLRGASSSDKDESYRNSSRLNQSIMTNQPSAIVPLAWKPPQPLTDVNKLLEKVLGLKHSAASPSTSKKRPQVFSDATLDRQQQFYQAYKPFKETDPIELSPGFSESEAEIVIRAVYRQVLGNAYVMESERLVVPESQLKQGEISVREFVRQLAKSELYRSRFFDNCYRYRAIELNFKHLLGRAPDNFEEMRYHSSVLDNSGFEADIDSYINSDEYQNAFGENLVPFYRGYKTQPGQSMLEFTNMLELLRSASSSDKNLATNNQAQLTRQLIRKAPYCVEKQTDVGLLLAKVLKPKPPVQMTPNAQAIANQALERQMQEQEAEIATLQRRLSDLRPFATIGYSITGGGQLASASTVADKNRSLQAKVDAQAEQIAALKAQIADTQRLATIGEARLNRWRSRTFS